MRQRTMIGESRGEMTHEKKNEPEKSEIRETMRRKAHDAALPTEKW